MRVQRRRMQCIALSISGLWHRTLDGPDRRPLTQLSGRRAPAADDLCVLRKAPRAGHTRQLQRARRRDRGVQVHEHQERRRSLDDVLEQVTADAAVTENVVFETEAEHPLPRRAAPPLDCDHIANVVE